MAINYASCSSYYFLGNGKLPHTAMDFPGKRIVVMGLGRFGGGVGVTRYLVNQNADVLVTDLLPETRLRDSLAQLSNCKIRLRLGEHRADDFTSADLVVVNPAVDCRNNPYLQAAQQATVPFTSEIRLLATVLPNRDRVIGVTGTAGKSTVTAMIAHAMRRCIGANRVHVGGNIGGSLLDCVDQITPEDWVVLELSSFMLEGLAQDRWSPHIAVVTNLKPNHLDRHGNIEAYAEAKQAIFDYQNPHDHAILGLDAEQWFQPVTPHTYHVNHPPNPAIPLTIPGEHNQLNAALTIQTVCCAGINTAQAKESLADFAGLPHRLQLVCEHNDVRYFNDSKATTPEAAILAISSFMAPGENALHQTESPNIHVILGGYDKASDLTPLAQFAAQHCTEVYTIGTTGDVIAAAVEARHANVYRCDTLDRAVEQACQQAQSGSVVLLSPGCASWDQFENYEARGAAFVESILKYNTERQPTNLDPPVIVRSEPRIPINKLP